jgi:hypothetical protein
MKYDAEQTTMQWNTMINARTTDVQGW